MSEHYRKDGEYRGSAGCIAAVGLIMVATAAFEWALLAAARWLARLVA